MISKSVVQHYLDANLNVIGVSNKIPANGSWKRWQSEMRTAEDLKGDGVGIICGKIISILNRQFIGMVQKSNPARIILR